MKKAVIFIFFFMSTSCLLSSDTNSFPRTVISTYDLSATHFLKENGCFEDVHTPNDHFTWVRVSSDHEIAVLEFRKNRTQELELMRKELKTLKILYLSGGVRTREELANIERAIDVYSQKWIPQREQEERLSSLEFFSCYKGRLQDLKNDIKTTSHRVSELIYKK